MRGNARRIAYLVGGLLMLVGLLAGPQAWAVPELIGLGQTVPTRTPSRPAPPVEPPTSVPPTEQPAAPTVQLTAAVPGTPASGLPAVVTPRAASTLSMSLVADRTAIWSGARVSFTLTLVNAGTVSVRQVLLESTLPQELEPGEVTSPGAAWEGRTLRARVPVLAPGGRLLVTFAARVSQGVAPGGAVYSSAKATAAGGLQAEAGVVLALPPSELPPTGQVDAWGP